MLRRHEEARAGRRRESCHQCLITTQMSGTCARVIDALTAPQERLMKALRSRLQRGEPGPTYREMCSEMGWKSTGTVRDHLKVLARKGLVELANGRARLTRLKGEYRPTSVPVVGSVTAGIPISVEQVSDSLLSVPTEWVGCPVDFAVEVSGESMQGADILDGDLVLVRRQSTADDGEVVVATVDGETTLKTLRKRGKSVSLVAENPKYKAINV